MVTGDKRGEEEKKVQNFKSSTLAVWTIKYLRMNDLVRYLHPGTLMYIYTPVWYLMGSGGNRDTR